ncbi:hypothetical protein BaRGS_00035111, partial [Batillaria attramentaria]
MWMHQRFCKSVWVKIGSSTAYKPMAYAERVVPDLSDWTKRAGQSIVDMQSERKKQAVPAKTICEAASKACTHEALSFNETCQPNKPAGTSTCMFEPQHPKSSTLPWATTGGFREALPAVWRCHGYRPAG